MKRQSSYTSKDYTSSAGSVSKDAGKVREKKPVAVPRPSSSVILISPQNQVLLLHRVQSSTSFASAHVFPGGNLSSHHEPTPPSTTNPHTDSPSYRHAAIRETFEESGILLAKPLGSKTTFLDIPEAEKHDARTAVHSNTVKFGEWLQGKGASADIDGLIPFTRWITPANLAKRFTTQMYLYFLPLSSSTGISSGNDANHTGAAAGTEAGTQVKEGEGTEIYTPTPDGGIEHTTAKFLPPATWLRLCGEARVMLFPPQFFLLHLISPFLSPHEPGKDTPGLSKEVLQRQREELMRFVQDGKWGEKCISPTVVATGKKREDGRVVLGLDRPGDEATGRKGDEDRVVLVEFGKQGPRRLEVGWRKDVLAEGREKEKL